MPAVNSCPGGPGQGRAAPGWGSVGATHPSRVLEHPGHCQGWVGSVSCGISCGQPGRSSQHPKPLSSSDSSSCLSSSSALHTVTVCAAISQFFLSVVMFPGICLCFGAAQLSLNIPPELCPPAQLCFRLEAFSEFHLAPGWPSRAGSRC